MIKLIKTGGLMKDLKNLAELIHERNKIDNKISNIIGRPEYVVI